MEQTVVDPVTEQAPVQSSTVPIVEDPFTLEEAQLASLSPEQRASLDPILEGWKKKASEKIETVKKSSVEEGAKPFKEKAEALDNLVKHPAFVQWWRTQQRQAMEGRTLQAQQSISQSKPQDFATPEEWSQAVLDASNGDADKLQAIQARMFAAMATPFVQESQQRISELSTKVEMRDLMEIHPDYKELDQIGLDAKGEGTSLLEFCLNWAEASRKPLEEGYQMARRWVDSMKSGAKAEAMGLVQGKKESVTAGPSTSSSAGTVVYVDSQDELIKKSMEATLDGRKDVTFQIRPKSK